MLLLKKLCAKYLFKNIQIFHKLLLKGKILLNMEGLKLFFYKDNIKLLKILMQKYISMGLTYKMFRIIKTVICEIF